VRTRQLHARRQCEALHQADSITSHNMVHGRGRVEFLWPTDIASCSIPCWYTAAGRQCLHSTFVMASSAVYLVLLEVFYDVSLAPLSNHVSLLLGDLSKALHIIGQSALLKA
jgi:hypothetical protein